jgi:hypothetical protein
VAASLSESSCLLHESRTNIIVRMDLRSLVESAHDSACRVGMREQLDLASAPASRRRARFFLLACLMMICSNGPSLHQKEEVEKFLLAVVARFKAFKKRVPSKTCGDKRPQRASASKAKSSVLSQLSGLENVVFNDFIDEELDSEDVSEQRASASLPDSVPIESEEERAAREADEMAALDSVGDYEADPNVMLEDVPQDIVIKTLKVSCACVPVLVFACVCVCVCTRRRCVFVRICICIF